MKPGFLNVKAAIFFVLVAASVGLVMLNGMLNARYATPAVSKQPGMDTQHDVPAIQIVGESDATKKQAIQNDG